jgi:hypothetical protein
MINNTSTSGEDSHTLNAASDSLQILFAARVGTDGQKVSLQFPTVGVWLYRCTDDFTDLLQKHHPAALAVLAHACLALNDLSSYWYMEGWVTHILAGVWERLPQKYKSWIQWPIQQIGWIPPEG